MTGGSWAPHHLPLPFSPPPSLPPFLPSPFLALALQALSFCKSSGRPRFVYLLTVLPGDHLGGHPGVGPRGCPIGPLRLIVPGPRHVAAPPGLAPRPSCGAGGEHGCCIGAAARPRGPRRRCGASGRPHLGGGRRQTIPLAWPRISLLQMQIWIRASVALVAKASRAEPAAAAVSADAVVPSDVAGCASVAGQGPALPLSAAPSARTPAPPGCGPCARTTRGAVPGCARD